MKHVFFERATPEQRAAATEAADWLVDAVATSTQDRRFLRGEPECDEVACDAIMSSGIIACLRAMEKAAQTARTYHSSATH